MKPILIDSKDLLIKNKNGEVEINKEELAEIINIAYINGLDDGRRRYQHVDTPPVRERFVEPVCDGCCDECDYLDIDDDDEENDDDVDIEIFKIDPNSVFLSTPNNLYSDYPYVPSLEERIKKYNKNRIKFDEDKSEKKETDNKIYEKMSKELYDKIFNDDEDDPDIMDLLNAFINIKKFFD